MNRLEKIAVTKHAGIKLEEIVEQAKKMMQGIVIIDYGKVA